MEERSFCNVIQDKNVFTVSWELVPGRGSWEESQEKTLRLAEQAAKGKKVHAVSLTDNPGGNIAIPPEAIGKDIQKLGLDTIIHVTCKDRNRSQLESQLYALERCGLHNILALTGDYDLGGADGRAKPVFDLDSTQLLELIKKLNAGMEYQTMKGKATLKSCHFFAGAAVSPFKATKAEQMLQYYKLKKKIKQGAQFIITQVGYDVRKFEELILYVQKMGWEIPLIGDIYILSYGAARFMNQNKVPGCVVTDKLLRELDEERNSPDKGKEAMLKRAAKQYAVLKGLGYKGVHLGGMNINYEQIEYIISYGEELSRNWQDYVREFDFPQKNGFYLFGRDPKTGLNNPALPPPKYQTDSKTELNYKVSRLLHKMFFEPGKKFFAPMQTLTCKIQGGVLEKGLHGMEYFIKRVMYNCQDCGDCALFDLAYICPMGDCPKNQRNGPCAGSYQGFCEVYPGQKKCAWVRAYERLHKYGEESCLGDYYTSPCNWELKNTSSWVNYYLGKDHSAPRLGIKPKVKDKN